MNFVRIRVASAALQSGRVRARDLVEQALEKASDPSGEGARIFLRTYAHQTRSAADAYDRLRDTGAALPEWAGIPITVKDLFDVKGEVTTAGSVMLADRPAASKTALAIERLEQAGFIVIGKTNLSEFAFSGLGLNPHYGTPLSPYQRNIGRVPGGSSSGAAVSVADGMALAGVGSDTGGSCRVPAAFCGIAGFKPTAGHIPTDGMLPLSPALDSVGVLAHSADCCGIVDAVMRGLSAFAQPHAADPAHFLVPESVLLDGLDPEVAAAFERALRRISAAGHTLSRRPLQALEALAGINAGGGFTAVESYPWHRELIEQQGARYDPNILARILKGRDAGTVELQQLVTARAEWRREVERQVGAFDAMLFPTVSCIAPAMEGLDDPATFDQVNRQVLRNSSFVNFLDGCALSVPCHLQGEAPVGLTIAGLHDTDARILGLADRIEKLMAGPNEPLRYAG